MRASLPILRALRLGALLLAVGLLGSPCAGAVTLDGAAAPAGAVGWAYGKHSAPQLWLFRDDRTAVPIGRPLAQRQRIAGGISVRPRFGRSETVVYTACELAWSGCDIFEVPLGGGRAKRLGMSTATWSERAVGAHDRWLAVARQDQSRAKRPAQLVVYRDGRPVLRRTVPALGADLPALGLQPERVVVTGEGIVWSLWSSYGCSGDRIWELVRTDAHTGLSRTISHRCASEDRAFPPGSVTLLGPAGDGVAIATGFAANVDARCLVTLDAAGTPVRVAGFANPGTVGGYGGRDDAPPGDAVFAVAGDRVHVSGWYLQGYLSRPSSSRPGPDRILAPTDVPLLPVAQAPQAQSACARSLLTGR